LNAIHRLPPRSTAAVRIVGVTSGISPSLVRRVGHFVGSDATS
jgi:hypothetical protein